MKCLSFIVISLSHATHTRARARARNIAYSYRDDDHVQATEAIVDSALLAGKPFAIVPCCVYPDLFPTRTYCGVHVRSYDQFIQYLMEKHPSIQRHKLANTPGRNTVLFSTGSL